LIVGFADGAAAGGLGGEAGFGEVEFVVGVAEEDEAEDGDGVFLGFEARKTSWLAMSGPPSPKCGKARRSSSSRISSR
jgi:hypothetical protein